VEITESLRHTVEVGATVSTGRVYDRIIGPEATIEIRDIIGEAASTACRRSTRRSSASSRAVW